MTGTVYLVGAGPGDPGLITVRGRELLVDAEVLVYDYLANPSLVALCPPSCERIYVGKRGGDHTMAQGEINALLVSLAQDGKSVVRLKGGDPFVFGRGGEEALELAENGVEFEVIPGITSGVAAPAYAGIPLTHRGLAASALLVTGHEAAGKKESDVDWAAIAGSKTSVAFYMGVKNLGRITERLIEHGRSPDTPTALIRWGTLPRQETLSGSLSDIAELAKKRGFEAPAICIVGEVAGLRKELRWFDKRPLFGKRIVVTRSRSNRSSLSDGLRKAGADVVELPTVSTEKEHDPTLSADLAAGRRFDWYVFTSQNGVTGFFEHLDESGKDSRFLAGARIACIGTATAHALHAHGLRADMVPARQTSDGLIDCFDGLGEDLGGATICFPCSHIAKDTIPSELAKRGAEVSRYPVYRTVSPGYTAAEIEAVFDPTPDLVTFTSSSTVNNLVSVLNETGSEDVVGRIVGAVIGPSTAATAREHAIEIGCESANPDIASLIQSILEYFHT